jgi:hypothetical protein
MIACSSHYDSKVDMRAAFLDLNGTLVEPVRVSHPREFYALPHALEAVRLLTTSASSAQS